VAFTDEDHDYPGWKDLAEELRQALHLLHFDVPQCLPGEPEACGGNFAEHALSYLAALRARVDNEIEHLGESAQSHVRMIYASTLDELRQDSPCRDHPPVQP
jgi:hypothetical protein